MNILFRDSFAPAGAEILRRHLGDRATITVAAADQPAGGVEVLVTTNFRPPLPAMPALRLIHLTAAGLDEVDLAAVPPGVALCNSFGHETGISEYVMAALLHGTVGLAERHERFKAGDWSDSPRLAGPVRGELAGRTIGCIGYGTIGRAVAQRARAFDMRVMAITRQPRPVEPEPDWIGGFGLVEALLEESDFVVVACPLNAATRHLLGPLYLGAMKPHAILINVARGPVVDPKALFELLQAGRIGGAVLDTWYAYPSPEQPRVAPADYPFHELDNVIMTPHCSGWTTGLLERRFGAIADNIARLMDGRPLLNQVPV